MLKKWKKIKTEETFKLGKYYVVTKDKVITPGGKDSIYYVIRKEKQSVRIIPIDGEYIYMTIQHRYPINQMSIDFPAGYIDKNETPLAAAKRELFEEIGAISDRWNKIGKINEANGISDISNMIFVANDVCVKENISKDPLDKNLHEIRKFTYDQMKKMISGGKVRNSATLSAFALGEVNGVFDKFKILK